jgi:hypothetical protein
MRTQVWSDGGGTQSAAIAVLILTGRLPKPDLVVISDTERERSSVWDYHDNILVPALSKIGLEIHRIKKSEFSKEDLWANYGPSDEPHMMMPVFIKNATDGGGRLPTTCSSRWKRRVVQRWLRSVGVKQCDVWLGMSLDEMRRVRISGEQWYQFRYPLVFDVPMRRGECIRIVEEFGWPTPPRSACWMCPNRVDAEWREMKERYPSDFLKAVELEREIWKRRPDFFLHRSLQPLDQVDFSTSQLSLLSGSDDNACTEGCFT